MAIRAFLNGKIFDPEALDTLNKAFQSVCAELGVSDNAHHSREIIAKSVLELSDGERDPEAIRAAVVARLAEHRRDER